MESAPPSPSVFLNLPPTPQLNGNEEDDRVLTYISRTLMEEEEDIVDKFLYQNTDNPALLQVHQTFAQILSYASSDALDARPYSSVELSAPASVVQSGAQVSNIQDSAAAAAMFNSMLPGDSSSCCMDVVSMAFFKGMEEANKFLSGGGEALRGRSRKKRLDGGDVGDDDAVMGRRSKQMAVPLQSESEEEEAAAREMLDQLMLNGYEPSLADRRELRVAMEMQKTPLGRPRAGVRQEVDLHCLLIRCADAVVINDQGGAADLLERIRTHSSPTGDGTQRLAHYFADALEARLSSTGSQMYWSLMPKRGSVAGFLKASQLYMAACCFLPVNFSFSNKAIYKAVAGRNRLHIVQFGLHQGVQWPELLRLLALRDGGPPQVRFTGVDTPQPGFRPAQLVEETGCRLRRCAHQLGVPFEFRGVAARSEDVRAEDIDIDPDEVLVVNALFHFRNLVDESYADDGTNPMDTVLDAIREMGPSVFIHAIVNTSYSTSYFLTRFREALYNFTALFDMMDAVMPGRSGERLLIEREVFARCAMNVVACEGPDRVQRPQSYKQWQARSQRAGLRQLPLDPDIVGTIKAKVKKEYHKYFTLDEDRQWLLQGWKGRVLYALSIWTADDKKEVSL